MRRLDHLPEILCYFLVLDLENYVFNFIQELRREIFYFVFNRHPAFEELNVFLVDVLDELLRPAVHYIQVLLHLIVVDCQLPQLASVEIDLQIQIFQFLGVFIYSLYLFCTDNLDGPLNLLNFAIENLSLLQDCLAGLLDLLVDLGLKPILKVSQLRLVLNPDAVFNLNELLLLDI